MKEPRQLTDPQTMRALAHPLRLRLLHLLHREGTLTATRASELVGESTASTSFHLRQLAKYGFVEPAGGGKGRERPWRAIHAGTRFDGLGETPELVAAESALLGAVLEQNLAALEEWVRTAPAWPREWREAAMTSDSLLYLTSAELAELGEDVLALVRRHMDRTLDPALRPPDARPVTFLAYSFPIPPTDSGS